MCCNHIYFPTVNTPVINFPNRSTSNFLVHQISSAVAFTHFTMCMWLKLADHDHLVLFSYYDSPDENTRMILQLKKNNKLKLTLFKGKGDDW